MGTLTINTTVAQDQRIVVAFGRKLGLGRDATGPEVKQAIIQMLVKAVQEQEQQEAVTAALTSVAPLDPT